jgi:hypothetical protein
MFIGTSEALCRYTVPPIFWRFQKRGSLKTSDFVQSQMATGVLIASAIPI